MDAMSQIIFVYKQTTNLQQQIDTSMIEVQSALLRNLVGMRLKITENENAFCY